MSIDTSNTEKTQTHHPILYPWITVSISTYPPLKLSRAHDVQPSTWRIQQIYCVISKPAQKYRSNIPKSQDTTQIFLIDCAPLALLNFGLLYVINALSLEWNPKPSIIINPQCTYRNSIWKLSKHFTLRVYCSYAAAEKMKLREKLRNSQSSTASEGYNGPNIYWLKYLSLLLNTYLHSRSGPEELTSAPAHQYLTWFCCHAVRCWVETKHSYRHSLSHTDVNTLVLDIRHYCVMKISLSGPVGMGWHLELLRGHQHTKGPDPKPRISPCLCLLRQ